MTENTKPLRWHKFLIYFALWAGALLNVRNALIFLSGSHYGEMKYAVYQAMPIVQWVDIAVGLAGIALAAFMIYTRFQLAGFKKGAPKKLLLVYVIGIAITLGYVLLVYATTGIFIINSEGSGEIIGSIVQMIVFLLINKVYYDKRAELFVN